jgi:hypothetical protein
MDGIVLQQSWLCCWVCDEHGIVLQHCRASSGVVIAPQSNAYTAIANATTTNKIGLAARIVTKLGVSSVEVKHKPVPGSDFR